MTEEDNDGERRGAGVRTFLLGDEGRKGLLDRSGVRTCLALFLSTVAYAWSNDNPIGEALKENTPILLPALLFALGLSSNPSMRSRG